MTTTARIELQRCVGCSVEKPLDAFAKDGRRSRGRVSRCRECQKAYFAAYYAKNRDAIAGRTAAYQRENKQIQQAAKKRWQSRNREAHLASRRKWHAGKFETDIEYRLNFIARGALRRTLEAARRNNRQMGSAKLPYSPAQLKARIEMNFCPGMNWDNYGEWHIDHRAPIARLVRRGVVDPAVINALSNLVPLWAEDNLRKGKR